MVRSGYLKNKWDSDGGQRGREEFVAVSWDVALNLAAEALSHTKNQFGNRAIYGGSYGWASAGRFHHALSQIHRFLNQFGGYVESVDTYSTAAAEVIIPHVLGLPFIPLLMEAPTTDDIAANCKTMVLFGGAAMKNTQVMYGGIGEHSAKAQLQRIKKAGIRIFNVSPIKDDTGDFLEAEWVPCRPGSDVAIMLGMAHTLVEGGLHDVSYLAKYSVGFERFLPYLMGEDDGQCKDAEWAATLADVPAEVIREMALCAAKQRSVIGVSWSLQRQEHGEQTYWMFSVLGAMLGQIGLPGGGVAYGYGCDHNMGFNKRRLPTYAAAALEQGSNPVSDFIPVARVTDMLLNPGGVIDYNGQQVVYPDIKLVYWCGGNPFHHQQDLNRLRQAWSKPETIIVNESVWTATARHADIVFPATTTLERNDLSCSSLDCYLSPMPRVVEPYQQARTDYAVFSGLAERLDFASEFTEGRSEMDWVRHLYEITAQNANDVGITLPEFESFWRGEDFSVYDQLEDTVFMLEKFREDPEANPLKTPSGKIEIFSETIDSYNYKDCQGHPRWYDKQEWLGSALADKYPLHLISNQPKTRLHSQYDHGVVSRENKIKGRERARMNPGDARMRGVEDGDVIRLFNDRGACLAGIELSESIRKGVVELPTGAWFDPQDSGANGGLEIHGNPNVLTRDVGTSKLAQGSTAHSCLVQVERFDEPLPAITVFSQPPIGTE